MTTLLKLPPAPSDLRRRAEIVRFLDEIIADLDITASQFERAEQSYNAVGEWLNGSDNLLLQSVLVYLHGSTGLGTSVKPLGRAEFDIDLICFLAGVSLDISPAAVKKAVGDRLRAHDYYASILEEKKRCWRLNYAGDFHLDISPTITNPHCLQNGELVPDRELRDWHPTNPKAYKALFQSRAELQARFIGRLLNEDAQARAHVEPFPARVTTKTVLQRVVQLLKRHRDIHFEKVKEEVAPISIVITTLAMRSYEYCVRRHVFQDELELLVDTIRMMPHFVDRTFENGREIWAVWNETTQGENFADRWNSEPARARAFFKWHGKALADFEAVRDAVGRDVIIERMSEGFGEKVVGRVSDRRTAVIDGARKSQDLYAAPAIGLVTSPAAAAVPVPKNTFFGD